MTDEEKTLDQRTAARLLALLEEHQPVGVEIPGCGHLHYCNGREEPWHSFTIAAIDGKSDDYKALSDLIRDAEPDDEAAYEWAAEVLEAIEEGSITDEDSISEWADGATPVYTWTLLQWIAQSTNRLALVEDMAKEYGVETAFDGFTLMRAYCFGLERFARDVWNLVQDRADDGKESAE